MSGGVKTALNAAMDDSPDDPTMTDLVQGGLFDLDETETGRLDAPSPLAAALVPVKAKRGRPLGAKNRRTEAVTAWLLQQARHPVQVMMEAYAMTPVQLAERIGLRQVRRTKTVEGEEVEVGEPYWPNDLLVDLLKLQLRMAEAAAPYVAQKLPQAVQIDAKASVQFVVEGVSLPAPGGASGNLDGDVIEGQLAVRLPEVGHEKSDDDLTDGLR